MSDGTYKGTYNVGEGWETNINADFLVGASKKFNKFSVDASFGGNTFRVKNHNFNETVTNLPSETFSPLQTGLLKPKLLIYNQSRVNSLYGLAEFGYNSMFYLNFTGRTTGSLY